MTHPRSPPCGLQMGTLGVGGLSNSITGPTPRPGLLHPISPRGVAKCLPLAPAWAVISQGVRVVILLKPHCTPNFLGLPPSTFPPTHLGARCCLQSPSLELARWAFIGLFPFKNGRGRKRTRQHRFLNCSHRTVTVAFLCTCPSHSAALAAGVPLPKVICI